MEKNIEGGTSYTRRHLSQLKILSRLLEHELELAKGDEVVIEKSLLESSLDLIDIFVEDLGGAEPRAAAKERKLDGKAQVTRLN
ncbi:MAG TPA: hypothetical protein PKE00_03545 [Planctomycetota bacterium]|nr:hypothetical protein [Planctomycetota bacterium]